MSLDRLLTLHVASPLLRTARALAPVADLRSPGARADSRRRVPILMYHSISDDPEPGLAGYYRLCTPPARFREHLAILKEEGFQATELATAISHLHDAAAQPTLAAAPKPVVITFDDGHRDFHDHAWPILQEFNFTATVFLPTGYISNPRCSFKDRECLTWSEVRALRHAGACFGSHTATHPALITMSRREVASELRESKVAIEQELQEAVDTFSHPYAFPSTDANYRAFLRQTLEQLGYRYAVTTNAGRARPADDRLQLPRLPINGADDSAFFRAKISGAYDWMAGPQRLYKSVRRRAPFERSPVVLTGAS